MAPGFVRPPRARRPPGASGRISEGDWGFLLKGPGTRAPGRSGGRGLSPEPGRSGPGMSDPGSPWARCRGEGEGNGIHAVTGILGCEAFSEEDMSQVGPAPGALDLGSGAIRVRQATDASRDLLIEARPTAMGVELAVGAVEGLSAALARVGPGLEVPLVLPGEGSLGPLVEDDPFLRRRELPEGRGTFDHDRMEASVPFKPEGRALWGTCRGQANGKVGGAAGFSERRCSRGAWGHRRS